MKVEVKKVIFFLSSVCLFLIAASLFGAILSFYFGHDSVYGLIRLFNLDSEQNIPTLFAVLLILCSSALLYILSVYDRNCIVKRSKKWRVLSILFFYIAVDEFASLHELLIRPLRTFISEGDAGIFYFTWVIPGFIVVVFLSIYFLNFLFDLPKKTRLLFIFAAIIYVGGALGVELVGGAYAESHGLFTFTYNIITTIEESMEMFGLIIFIHALLNYMKEHHHGIRIDFV